MSASMRVHVLTCGCLTMCANFVQRNAECCPCGIMPCYGVKEMVVKPIPYAYN